MRDGLATVSRRRFLRITAAAAGCAAWSTPHLAAGEAQPIVWRGTALGADARMTLHHADPSAAREAIAGALQEVRRLERIFSLYRPDSVLVELNRRGVLGAPPRELVSLLNRCRDIHRLSAGSFDPTVQPLWRLYADHFSGSGDPDGPPPAAVAARLELVGLDRVLIGEDRIAFRRSGMAITLNGIAQGYITDRVVDLLRRRGFDRSLVDMGEARALGPRPDGTPWRIGLADPDDPSALERSVAVVNQAVATSGGYGFRFDPAGRFNHLLDPHSGRSAELYRSVTVVMPTATDADALSTAFSFSPPERIEAMLCGLGQGTAYLATREGSRLVLHG